MKIHHVQKWNRLRFTNPEIYIPQDSTSRRRRIFDDPWGGRVQGAHWRLHKISSTVILNRTGVSLFHYFLYLKVNLDLEKTNQLGESSSNFIFAAVNLDPIVIEKRWTDGESWPNDFLEKVNRGEDLRWVGSRCPLTRALEVVLPAVIVFPTRTTGAVGVMYCVRYNYNECRLVLRFNHWLRSVGLYRLYQRLFHMGYSLGYLCPTE